MAISFSMAKVVMLLLMILMAGCRFSIAEFHHVGDESDYGWRSMDQGYYQDWAANRNFQVGDTLVFSYDPQVYEYDYTGDYHNVKQVTQDDFESCNPTSPIASYSYGLVEISLDRPGHYYFICGYPGHCLGGQKVHIVVNPTSPIASPSAAPSSQPSLNNAPSPYPSQLWLIIGVLVLCVYGFLFLY